MNRQIRRFAGVLLVLYVALFAQLNMVQLFGAERLRDSPDNTRPLFRDFDEPRGAIVTADGVVAARSVEIDDPRFERRREYPEGDLYAPITGYFSFNFGADGVERTYSDELTGQTAEQQLLNLGDLFVADDPTADVVLSIRDDVQRVAREQLGERQGSVVAVDPRSGAVLAAWSWPSYDPNFLSDPDAGNAEAARQLLLASDLDPLLPKWYREIYFPGSTFKVVTASAGLETGAVTATEPVYPSVTGYTPPFTDRPLSNFGGNTCGGDLFAILRRSCNSSFAQMAAEHLGPEPLIGTAEAYGFNDAPPLDLPAVADSNFPTDYGETFRTVEDYLTANDLPVLPSADGDPVPLYDDTPRLAQSGIGQNDVKATPLQMALVAAAVARDGAIMEPYVVERVVDREGVVLDEREPSVWRQAIRPSVAFTLRQAMVGVVEGGTASNMAIPGVVVGGKTGTAQLGTPEPQSHAWIIGFAGPEGETPHVAVAVLVEAQPGASEQTGGSVAAPIARAVIEQALSATSGS